MSDNLQLFLYFIPHNDQSGHHVATATEDALPQHFFWSTMSADVEIFVRSYIHCRSTVRAGTVLRPFSPTVPDIASNNLLQIDYIEIAAAPSGEKYVLKLCDDFFNFYALFALSKTASENVSRAVRDWTVAIAHSRV